MSTKTLEELIRQAERLTVDEQLRLVANLVERARKAYTASAAHRKWREICGAAQYPLLGEDAQQWVSRTRREADQRREQQWRHTP